MTVSHMGFGASRQADMSEASGGSIFEKMNGRCVPATGRTRHQDRDDFTFCGHRLSSLFRKAIETENG